MNDAVEERERERPAADFLFDPRTVNLTPGGIPNTEPLYTFPADSTLFRLRPLCSTDYARGHLDLLSQLTVTGAVTRHMYSDTFDAMKNAAAYYIIVVEDLTSRRIVATGSLVLENKFIHSCGRRGRIEDIVVHSDYRGKRFGKMVVQCLISIAREIKCYKISLECKDGNVNWYSSMGFVREHGNSNYMQIRFEKSSH